MVRKLDEITRYFDKYCITEASAGNPELFKKLNELMDIVNALIEENNVHERQIDELQMKVKDQQIELNNHLCRLMVLEGSDGPVVVDKFEEQKKWIGKLCRFWDDGDKQYVYDVLDCIDTDLEDTFGCFKSKQHGHFCNCEAIKTHFDELFQD